MWTIVQVMENDTEVSHQKILRAVQANTASIESLDRKLDKAIAKQEADNAPAQEFFADIATAGRPRKRPSMAAATVPEYKTSSPRLGPWLIPETTISGSSSNSPVTARWTQSVGVPLT